MSKTKDKAPAPQIVIPEAVVTPEKAPERRPIGRPALFPTKEDFFNAVQDYVEYCMENRRLPNKAGFCVFHGISRDSFYEYAKKPEYSDAISTFLAYVEDSWVQKLGYAHATGAIFYLKNAFKDDYKDTYDSDHTGRVIHYVLPAEIASKHGVPITKAEIIEEKHETKSLPSGSDSEAIAAQQQAEDGGARPQSDGEAGADAHQHQLEEEDREMPEAVR